MKYEIKEIEMIELVETLELVKRVFDEFEAPFYSQEGIENFYKFIDFDNMKKVLKENYKMYVAKKENKIIGMIAFRDNSHIALLFIDKKYHKNGIARKLFEKAKEYCIENNKNLEKITVNSSPYAVGFYEKVGFIKTSEEQVVDGIRFTPMSRVVYSFCEYEDSDFEWLQRTKKACFKWYVEKIYGWDDEVQIDFTKKHLEKYRSDTKIIIYGNKNVGVYTNYIDENGESFVSLFFIDENFQNKGIGTCILKDQLYQDKKNNRNTVLQVFKENPARLLYQRLGFEVYEETETHYKMRRRVK